MRRNGLLCALIALCLAALGVTGLCESALDIDGVYRAAVAAAGEEAVQLVSTQQEGIGSTVRVDLRDAAGRRYYLFFGISAEQPDTLKYVFYGDPEDYTVDESLRGAALEALNALNATQRCPALFLGEGGYIAGHAQQALSEQSVGEAISSVNATLEALDAALYALIEAADTPEPTPEATPEPAPDPTAAEEPSRKIVGYDTITVQEKCDICHGTGICNICHGAGHYPPYGFAEYRVECDPECKYCDKGYRTSEVLVYVYDDGTTERVIK